jgi:hypothetical protein
VKKYLLLFHDQWEPKPEVQAAWQSWFATVGDRFVDSGNPFGLALEVTPAGDRPLSAGDGAATGYSIVSAESLEAARALLDGCPFASSVRVYEAVAM